MKLVFLLFFMLTFGLTKAQIDPVKSADRIIQRTTTSTEKRLEQTANQAIDKKINQTLTPAKSRPNSNSTNLKAAESKNPASTIPANKTVKTEVKETQVKTITKPSQKNNDTKAHGSLLPPSK